MKYQYGPTKFTFYGVGEKAVTLGKKIFLQPHYPLFIEPRLTSLTEYDVQRYTELKHLAYALEKQLLGTQGNPYRNQPPKVGFIIEGRKLDWYLDWESMQVFLKRKTGSKKIYYVFILNDGRPRGYAFSIWDQDDALSREIWAACDAEQQEEEEASKAIASLSLID